MFGGSEGVGGLRGVGSSRCLGKGGLGCLKVWMGSDVLEGFGMFKGRKGRSLGGRGFGGGGWDVRGVRYLKVWGGRGLSNWVFGGVRSGLFRESGDWSRRLGCLDRVGGLGCSMGTVFGGLGG